MNPGANLQQTDNITQVMLCDFCALAEQCTAPHDLPPKSCAWLRQTLAMALAHLPGPAYDVCLEYGELAGRFYLSRNHVVVFAHNHPAVFLGQMLLRETNPEWFPDETDVS